MQDTEFQEVIRVIKENHTIELNLAFKSLSLEQVTVLAEALKTNTSLISINLRNNQIEIKCIEALADVVVKNTSINNIDLSENLIGDGGIKVLAEAIKSNTTIKYLRLDMNLIGVKGAKALAEVLKYNTSINNISLFYNQIGDNGVEALSEAFAANKTLASINLSSNLIGDEGVKTLAKVLETNKTLTNISLYDNQITANSNEAFSIALKHNFNILMLNGVKKNYELKCYTIRNHTLLKSAFKHAYGYFYNGININIVNSNLSPNPISAKDIYLLKHHKEEVKGMLAIIDSKYDYKDFYKKLNNYSLENYFSLKGYCKDFSNLGNFLYLPEDLIFKITSYVLDTLEPNLPLAGSDKIDSCLNCSII
jgi:hypothetical protein